MAKRALGLVFAFLLSINSFAAIVSDNDGAAFVSKAEFEALKIDFADQLDNYNLSIDAKIDGAIANYLASISIEEHFGVTLISAIDVPTGSGYRAWKNTDLPLSAYNRNTNDWILGLTSSICYRAGWADINTGEVDTLWANQARTSRSPASGTFKWYIKHNDYMTTINDGNWATPPVGTMVLTGLVERSGKYFPNVFVDENGRIDEFSDKSALTIVMRKARGRTGSTDNYRYWLLAGVTRGNKPAANRWAINELYNGLPIKCLNSQDSTGAEGFGNVLTILRGAIHKFNPNVFIWNPGSKAVTAYASGCENVEVNHAANVDSFTAYGMSTSLTHTRLIWGGAASGTAGQGTHMVPLISFEYAAEHTNLPSSAFASTTGFPYGRMLQKYLQLSDFKSSTDASRNLYVYEGLPLYKADREGALEFNVKIIKSSWTTSDAARQTIYNDPNSNIKVRIKDTPFKLDDDYSDCLDITINGTTSKEGSINAGNTTKIKFQIEKGKTYYMRWYCEGYDYGGEIIYLGDAYEIS